MYSIERKPTIPEVFEETLENIDLKIGGKYKLGIKAPSDLIVEGRRAYNRFKKCGCFRCERRFSSLAEEYATAIAPYVTVYDSEVKKKDDKGSDRI